MGTGETYRWPSDKPVWTITALLLTVVAVLAVAGYAYTREWTYFQQAYLVENNAVSGCVPD